MTGGICLAGRAGSGKSPLAGHICHALALLGEKAAPVSFADAIKQEVWELYGLKKEDLGGREALIEHGNARIQLDPTYWVRRLMTTVEGLWRADCIPVVDDVRREPEYARLTHHGFYRVKVLAPLFKRMEALRRAGLDPAFAMSTDPTECAYSVWKYDEHRLLIHTSQDFRTAAEQIVDRWLTG